MTSNAFASNRAPHADDIHELALRCLEEEDWNRAVDLLERASRLAPTSAVILTDLGCAHERVSQPLRALECHESAGALGSGEGDFFAALILAKAGRLDAAARKLVRAIQRDPDFAYSAEADPEWERLRPRSDVQRAIRRALAKERAS